MGVNTVSVTFVIDGSRYSATEVKNTTVNYLITETGLLAFFGERIVYTYEGEGSFSGFSMTEGATTPDNGRAIGDTISFQATSPIVIDLGYAVAVTQEKPKFSFGNLPIANMYFGTQQVKKVYLGNTLVWEKEN